MGKKKSSSKASKREGMSMRSIEEAKLALATPNDRRHDALFAAAPDLMALCFAFARTVVDEDSHRSNEGLELRRSEGDLDPRTVRPTSSELRATMGQMAEQLRHHTVEAINQLLATSEEDDEDESEVSTARTKLRAELHALALLSGEGVRLVDEAHRRRRNSENVTLTADEGGGHHKRREVAQMKEEGEEEEEEERRVLASMRSACGLLESLYAQALCASSGSQSEGLSTWVPLSAQVVSQLVSVVDSVVSAAGRVLGSFRYPKGLGVHLIGAVDAQLHLLSVLLRGDSGQVEARLLHQHADGIQFLAALLELEHRVIKLESGKPDEANGELCRRAADVAGRLRLGDAAERQEDLDELTHLGVELAAAADEARRLAIRASHVTGASLLPGKGPATPKLPREDSSSKWDLLLAAAAAQSASTVESTIMPAVVDNSRLLTNLAAHRLATSRDALNDLSAKQTPDEARAGPSPWAQLRRIFRRCGTLSALAASLVAHRSANISSVDTQRQRLCEVGAADFVRQQVYAAVFEVNKLSLILQTVCSTLDSAAACHKGAAGLGAYDRERAMRAQSEELAGRVSARLNRFEAVVAAALPPTTPAEQLRLAGATKTI